MAQSLRETLADGEDILSEIKKEVSLKAGCDSYDLPNVVFRVILSRVGNGKLRLRKAFCAVALLGLECGEAENALKQA